MHQRIDQLHDQETVLALSATMNLFLEGRRGTADSNSPEIVARLKQASVNQEAGPRGIGTNKLIVNMPQWCTHRSGPTTHRKISVM